MQWPERVRWSFHRPVIRVTVMDTRLRIFPAPSPFLSVRTVEKLVKLWYLLPGWEWRWSFYYAYHSKWEWKRRRRWRVGEIRRRKFRRKFGMRSDASRRWNGERTNFDNIFLAILAIKVKILKWQWLMGRRYVEWWDFVKRIFEIWWWWRFKC